MEPVKQYLVAYMDWAGETETTIMVTAVSPEVGLKALGIGRVITCEEIDNGLDDAGVHPGGSFGLSGDVARVVAKRDGITG
jgi:hypothetical protein